LCFLKLKNIYTRTRTRTVLDYSPRGTSSQKNGFDMFWEFYFSMPREWRSREWVPLPMTGASTYSTNACLGSSISLRRGLKLRKPTFMCWYARCFRLGQLRSGGFEAGGGLWASPIPLRVDRRVMFYVSCCGRTSRCCTKTGRFAAAGKDRSSVGRQ